MKKIIIISVILVILALGGGFFAGMQYQKSQTANRFAQFAGGQNGTFVRRFGQGGPNGNMSAIRGQVVSADNNSITVKLQDGSSKIAVVGSDTAFTKSTSGALSDIKAGDNVMIFGTTNSDGSVTAQNVQINPEMGLMRGGTPSAAPKQ